MTVTTMTTYDEALAVAKKQGVGEQGNKSDQDYLFSICKAISACPLEEWNGLQESTQQWYDSAVRLNNEHKSIPKPEGFKKTVAEQKPKEQIIVPPAPIPVAAPVPVVLKPNPTVELKTVSGRTQSAVPDISNTLQEAKKITLPALKPPKPEGVVGAIRKTLILNPDWTTRKVHEYLTQNGWPNLKLDVVAVNAGDIRRTIAMVKEMGYWRDGK